MTVGQSIKKWLEKYNVIIVDVDENGEVLIEPEVTVTLDIDLDQLGAGNEESGVFKLPNSIVRKHIDGSSHHTEYYLFAIRQPTQLSSERISNAKWLEELETWVDENNNNGVVPNLTDKRFTTNIEISSTYYLSESSEENGVYQLSLEIQYEKEI